MGTMQKRHARETGKAWTPESTTLANLGSAQSAGAGVTKLIDAIKLAISTPQGWYTLPSITPYPRTREGIVNAINAIRYIGNGCGVVQYEDAVYDISDYSAGPIILYSGICHNGVRPAFDFSKSIVPDQTFTLKAGTIFDGGSAGYSAFELNNLDITTATEAVTLSGATFAREANYFASNGQSSFCVSNIGFRGTKAAVDAGGLNNIGALYATFEYLYAQDSTDLAFNFENFLHCDFKNIYSKNIGKGGGIRFASTCDSSALIPGNSDFDEIYVFCGNELGKGIIFEANAGSLSCQLNQIKTSGRLQCNRYTSTSTPKSYSVTTTSGSSNLVCSNSIDYANFLLGIPVYFSTAPSGFTANTPYWISSTNDATLSFTLSTAPASTSAISATGTGTFTLKNGGFSGVSIIASTLGTITNSRLDGIDCEAMESVVKLAIRRIRNTDIGVTEMFSDVAGMNISVIDSSGKLLLNDVTGMSTYMDNSSSMNIDPIKQRTLSISASTTISSAYHKCLVVYNGSSDIQVTVPVNLIRTFEAKFIQVGVGSIQFVTSGTTIANSVGLFTAAAGSEVHLAEIGTANAYVLTGATSAS